MRSWGAGAEFVHLCGMHKADATQACTAQGTACIVHRIRNTANTGTDPLRQCLSAISEMQSASMAE